MKNKKLIFLIAIFLLGVGIWYFWPSTIPFQVQQVESQVDEQEELIKKGDKLIEIERSLTVAEKSVVENVLNKLVDASPKLAKIRTMQQAANRQIEFYGLVTDQHGEPVPNAKVTYSTLGYEGVVSMAGTVRTYWKNTDRQGRFSVLNVKGEHISIRGIEKQGYEFGRVGQTYYTYPQWVGHKPFFMGNESEPVILRAWKNTEAEPLVHNEILIGFTPDGKNYALDLIKPKKTESGTMGDIKVSFNRPNNAKKNEDYSWSVSIRAMGGGLLETSDIFMNEAPESGYRESWSVSFDGTESDYTNQIKKKFYFKSRNGKVFGRLEAEFIPVYNNQAVIDAKWWLNPNGSRNLQYDPSKRILLKKNKGAGT